jgi:hypothetical protein
LEDWRDDLDSFFKQIQNKRASEEKTVEQRRAETEAFIRSKVVPAFEDVKDQLEKYGRTVTILSEKDNASIIVVRVGAEEFKYSIKVDISSRKAIPVAEEEIPDRTTGKRLRSKRLLRGEWFVMDWDINNEVNAISKEEIIRDVIRRYKSTFNSM